jgi:hypothetical protein
VAGREAISVNDEKVVFPVVVSVAYDTPAEVYDLSGSKYPKYWFTHFSPEGQFVSLVQFVVVVTEHTLELLYVLS